MASALDAPKLDLVLNANGVEVNLSPLQGLWTAEQYLKITDCTRQLIEFTDGVLEILPPVTTKHQAMVAFLYEAMHTWVEPAGGKVHFVGLQLRLGENKFRKPDLLLLLDAHDPRNDNRFWWGADLVAEVVSPDNPERDTAEKPGDYAAAGTPEYWIVNPLDETITVLRLAEDQYGAHGVFQRGDTATSALLAGFAVTVNNVFDAR